MNADEEMWLQNNHLRQQILALSKKSSTVRKRFQLLLVRCKRCDDVVLEVLDTLPYAVVRLRNTEAEKHAPPPEGATTEEVAAHWRSHFATRSPATRLDKNWRFYPIAGQAQPEDAQTLIPCACGCVGDRTRSHRWMRERMAAGKSATV